MGEPLAFLACPCPPVPHAAAPFLGLLEGARCPKHMYSQQAEAHKFFLLFRP